MCHGTLLKAGIIGEMWFGVGIKKHLHPSANEECRRLYNESILVNNYLAIFEPFCHLCNPTSCFSSYKLIEAKEFI
jgi:hypothetical protein